MGFNFTTTAKRGTKPRAEPGISTLANPSGARSLFVFPAEPLRRMGWAFGDKLAVGYDAGRFAFRADDAGFTITKMASRSRSGTLGIAVSSLSRIGAPEADLHGIVTAPIISEAGGVLVIADTRPVRETAAA